MSRDLKMFVSFLVFTLTKAQLHEIRAAMTQFYQEKGYCPLCGYSGDTEQHNTGCPARTIENSTTYRGADPFDEAMDTLQSLIDLED